MRRLLFATVLGFLLLEGVGLAQTTPPRVIPNTPITVEWDVPDGHTVQNGLQWRALVDGAITRNFVGADFTITPRTGGGVTMRATIPGVAPGSHTLVIREFCCVPIQQADSAPLTFVAEVSPTAPSLPRIITGTIAFRLEIQSDTAVPADVLVSQLLRIPNK